MDVNYSPRRFGTELEKTVFRLQQWKTRLPELLARVESSND
jgi:hypothetical protein